jgi:hypothetical protein
LHVPLPVSCINGLDLYVHIVFEDEIEMKNRSTIQTLTCVHTNPDHLYMKLNMKLVVEHANIQFRFEKIIYCMLRIIRDSARILRPLVTFAEQIFNELNLIISYFALLVSNGD